MNIPYPETKFKRVNSLLYEGFAPKILSGAIEAGLFDALASGPLHVSELAENLNADESMTDALARVLVSLNYLQIDGEVLSLNKTAQEYFVSSAPAFQGHLVSMVANAGEVIDRLPELLKNGPNKHDDKMWADTELMKKMGQMTKGGQVQDALGFITSLPEFYDMKRMCDLAGNHGFYTMALLDASPQLTGTICDLPETAGLAKGIIEDMGYTGRIKTKGIDIEYDDIGENYDLVFCSHVLYRWGKQGGLVEIFRRINRSMNFGGVFVSNHMTMSEDGCAPLSETVLELITRLGGYPSHHLTERYLKEVLESAGFGDFCARPAEEASQYHALLLAGRKIKEV